MSTTSSLTPGLLRNSPKPTPAPKSGNLEAVKGGTKGGKAEATQEVETPRIIGAAKGDTNAAKKDNGRQCYDNRIIESKQE